MKFSWPTTTRSGTQVFGHKYLFARHVNRQRIALIPVNGIRLGVAICKSCSMRNHLKSVERSFGLAFAFGKNCTSSKAFAGKIHHFVGRS